MGNHIDRAPFPPSLSYQAREPVRSCPVNAGTSQTIQGSKQESSSGKPAWNACTPTPSEPLFQPQNHRARNGSMADEKSSKMLALDSSAMFADPWRQADERKELSGFAANPLEVSQYLGGRPAAIERRSVTLLVKRACDNSFKPMSKVRPPRIVNPVLLARSAGSGGAECWTSFVMPRRAARLSQSLSEYASSPSTSVRSNEFRFVTASPGSQ